MYQACTEGCEPTLWCDRLYDWPTRSCSCWCGRWRILKCVTALSRSSDTLAISATWRLPLRTGTPLTNNSPVYTTQVHHSLTTHLTSLHRYTTHDHVCIANRFHLHDNYRYFTHEQVTGKFALTYRLENRLRTATALTEFDKTRKQETRCRRQAARHFMSLIILLNNSTCQSKLHRPYGVCKFLFIFQCNYVAIFYRFWDIQHRIMACPWNFD